MFPNLNAEQARWGHSNESTAQKLGLNRTTYENKKRTGRFSIAEINHLCELYNCDYDYLFADSPIPPEQACENPPV